MVSICIENMLSLYKILWKEFKSKSLNHKYSLSIVFFSNYEIILENSIIKCNLKDFPVWTHVLCFKVTQEFNNFSIILNQILFHNFWRIIKNLYLSNIKKLVLRSIQSEAKLVAHMKSLNMRRIHGVVPVDNLSD